MKDRLWGWAVVAFLALIGARQHIARPDLPTETREDRTRRLWNQFFAAQNELASQTRTVESQDASLGVIMGLTAAFSVFLFDHMKSGDAVPWQHIVSATSAVFGALIAVVGVLSPWTNEKLKMIVLEESIGLDEQEGLSQAIEQASNLHAERREAEKGKTLAQRLATVALVLAAVAFLAPVR